MPKPIQKTVSKSVPKFRTLEEANIPIGGGNFYAASTWFVDEGLKYSEMFTIHGAKFGVFKGARQVHLDLKYADERSDEVYTCSLVSNDERDAYVAAFEEDATPIGPLVFEKIDTGQGNPYMKIVAADKATQDEIPF